LRVRTQDGAEILFFVSHATGETVGPVFRYEFERAVVEFSRDPGRIIARFSDGSGKIYGCPEDQPERKLWRSLVAVRTGEPVPCRVSAAMAQTLCVNGAQESVAQIAAFPPDLIAVKATADSEQVWVRGLGEVLTRGYEQGRLPSEMGTPWAKGGRTVSLRDYRQFPSGLIFPGSGTG